MCTFKHNSYERKLVMKASGLDVSLDTMDDEIYGNNTYVYCTQHLRAHSTGWCTVSVWDKYPLEATTLEEAREECIRKGYKLFSGH